MADRIADDLRARPIDRPWIVFLGDLVDRGPDSRACLKAAMGLPMVDGAEQAAILGNHELYLAKILRRRDFTALDSWMRYGGRATLLSYGVEDALIDDFIDEPAAYVDRVAAAVPEHHVDWIEGLPRVLNFGDYVFVHAGLRPGVPLNRQDPDDFIWMREPFLSTPNPLPGHVVIHGHTPTDRVDLDGARICVDTAAAYGGPLTALVLDGTSRRVLQVYP